MIAGDERRKEMGEVVRGEDAGRSGDVGWQRLQGGVSVEGDTHAGQGVEALEEGGVEFEAEVGEGTELRRIIRIASGEHSRGGGGGLGKGIAAIEHDDAKAAVLEFEGEGEADDAGAGDADVGVLHKNSLVCFREVIVLSASGLADSTSKTAEVPRRVQ